MLLLDNNRFFVPGWDAAMIAVEHMRDIISGSVLPLRLEPGLEPGAR